MPLNRTQFFLTLSLLLAVIPRGQGQTRHRHRTILTARQIAQRTLPSVVVLFAQNAGSHIRSIGTGFFVDTDVIATNYHVVHNASEISAKLIIQKQAIHISEIIQEDEEKDLALLRVQGIRLKPLPLGNAKDLAIGDEIYVVGNPEGWEGTFSQGIISGFRNIGGSFYIQITAPISHGSSGGPVLNTRGEVIGMATAAIKEGQNLNFAISSAELLAFQRTALRDFIYSGINKPQKQEKYVGRVLAANIPTRAELIVCEGNKNYEHKLFARAAEKYQAAIRSDPKLAQAYYRLGNAYVEQVKYSDAFAAYKSAITLGDLYENLPATKAAIHAYERANAENPGGDHLMIFLLAEAYLKIGKDEVAKNKYRILRVLRSAYSDRLLKDIERYPNPDGFDYSGQYEIFEKEKCPK